MKNCTDGSSYQYLIDPYGLYGADIIAEINQVIYIIQRYCYHYSFQVLHYRSVRTISSETGEILNFYEYDPFGKVLQKSEQIHNNLQFLGRLGIFKQDELVDIYYMREQVYDANHGRFMIISVDPMGMSILDNLSYIIYFLCSHAFQVLNYWEGAPILHVCTKFSIELQGSFWKNSCSCTSNWFYHSKICG